MRTYFFGNLYLSSIQQGIQAAHATMELFLKYPPGTLHGDLLKTWAADHKTKILLNGGYADTLIDIHATLEQIDSEIKTTLGSEVSCLPHSIFREEVAALNGAVTSVAVVLPPVVYEMDYAYKRELRGRLEALAFESLLDAAMKGKDSFTIVERIQLVIMGFDLAR